MKITKDSYVTCEYELYTGSGKEEIVEKATPEAPLALLSLIHISEPTRRS